MVDQVIIIGAFLSFLILGFLIKKGNFRTIAQFSIRMKARMKVSGPELRINIYYSDGNTLRPRV